MLRVLAALVLAYIIAACLPWQTLYTDTHTRHVVVWVMRGLIFVCLLLLAGERNEDD